MNQRVRQQRVRQHVSHRCAAMLNVTHALKLSPESVYPYITYSICERNHDMGMKKRQIGRLLLGELSQSPFIWTRT